MGALAHGYFDNDGAADLLAEITNARSNRTAIAKALEGAFANFESFLIRDSQGLTFRPVSAEELAEQDRAVREALGDLPHLIEEWESGKEFENTSELLADTGDHEAQGAVAAAALVLAASGAVTLDLPKAVKKLAGLYHDPALLFRARSVLEALLCHPKLCAQFTRSWLVAVRKLRAAC